MIDNLEPLRIPGFRVLETGETGETYAIKQDLRFNSNIYYFNNRIESTNEYVINKIG